MHRENPSVVTTVPASPRQPGMICPSRLHLIFEQQAEDHPEAIAITFEGTSLTYREVNQRANAVTLVLRERGVQPDDLVAMLLDRSPEQIIAILAVFKAGGAYVPIDPSYPAARIEFVLADSRAGLLLTSRVLDDQVPASSATRLYLEDFPTFAESNPAPVGSSSNLAYVIYTSGSTGWPKGVMIEHRGLVNLARAQAAAFGVRAESRVLQFASLSFDASISEIAMAWQAGAALCLAPRPSLLPGPGLIELLTAERITHVTLPPSILAVLPEAELPALTTIVTAGESCSAEVVARWAPGRHFFNAYGPTETTVCATLGECRPGERPSIGRAMDGVEILLLDERRRTVPAGEPGEIYLGGIGLARGYLNQPELTLERFIPHPFSEAPGARLYRTGDLAREGADGRLDFLGRIDHQVKIRGYRIEPGEIEATLSRHPAVKHAAVLAHQDAAGAASLAAYVVSDDAEACEPARLRAWCRDHLPEYMVPAAFGCLPFFPLTVNGKIDRAALPEPSAEKSASFASPRTDTERRIAALWRRVLQSGEVSVNDNFFEAGGNSLKLAEVHSLLNREFGCALPVTALFQHPTVARLADYLKGASGTPLAIASVADRARRRHEALARQRPYRAVRP